jgi:membrane-associated protease RseP (regulator of RpoE activity)
MTALLYTLGVLVFVFALLASIALHELGHMVPAKKFGGKVTQYFIGFGPTVWSRTRGETEYGLKAFPLGGFVKIVGMLPPGAEQLGRVEHDEEGHEVLTVRRSNTGIFAQLVSDARAAEWEQIDARDADRLFYRMPWWKKVIVMAGGPTVNLLIAFLVFAPVFATYGNLLDVRIKPVVSEVLDCVVPATESGRACTPQDEVTPAKQAGLEEGDRIVAINGTTVSSWDQVQELIRGNDDGRIVLDLERDASPIRVSTNTTVTAVPVAGDAERMTEAGFLGVRPETELGSGGPLYTIDQMGTMTVDTVQRIGTLPVEVWGVGLAVVGLEERSPDSPVSIVGGGRIAGETAAHAEFPLQDKLVLLLMLIAGFNLFIGMFNFIPLLPLDGGHIAGALWEGLRRGVARLTGRPDPGHVDVARLLPVAYVVAGAMLVMGVVLIVGDLVAPLHIG